MTMNLHNESINIGGKDRILVLRVIVLAVLTIYVGRLAYLQIIQGNVYRLKAETQAIKEVTVDPFRGNIFDRNGERMVHNSPSFSISITPNEFEDSSIPLLASILQLKQDEIKQFVEDSKKISRVKPNKIYRDADWSIISLIEENHEFLPGVDISVESKRLYTIQGNMSHILGYSREINKRQIQTMGDYYAPGDIVGYAGLEKTYENFLRGTKGVQFVAVNSTGQKVSSFQEGKNDIQAEEGFDLRLGIDKPLQELSEKLLKGKRGGIVALDPNTGEIMALVSMPDYDIREFSGRTKSNLFSRLLKDEGKPLFNRATQTIYPPGSTWKLLMGIAALKEGIITPEKTIYCSGSYEFGSRSWKCHGSHGATNLQKAIHVSCNVFFNKIGPQLGIINFEKYGRDFGFGQKTFVDIPEDSKGKLPGEKFYKKQNLSAGEIRGRLVNLGIGQGEIGVSPLQMAVYCASLANKGIIHQPHIVRSIYNRKTKQLQDVAYASRKAITMSDDYWNVIHRGMYDVVNTGGGTALSAKVPGIAVCGKTGTAQNPHGEDHAWFIAFAPRENPRIALCVLVENAGFGGTVAAPIAQRLLTKFFYPSSKESGDSILLDTAMKPNKKPNTSNRPMTAKD
ncbi:MAG: penicillin-binding protein 2 [Ignavibacteria bacterium]|nr:penicillin-binding protein 2 [Ignavibacteria bacterium]